MSIFYNVKINADRDEKVQASFDQLGGSGAILDKQSDYQVGVVRFKIPITDIPLYRVYENEFFLGFSLRGYMSFIRSGNTANTSSPLYVSKGYLNNFPLFGGNNIFTNYGNYGIDRDYNNRKYVDIYSQQQFTALMNNALTRAFTQLEVNNYFNGANQVLSNTEGATYIVSKALTPGTYQTQAISGADNLLQVPVATWTASTDDDQTPTANYSYLQKGGLNPGYVITGFELQLGTLLSLQKDPAYVAGTQDLNTFNFANWEIVLLKVNASNDVDEEFIFCSGILDGSGDIESTTSTLGETIKIGTTQNCFIDAQTQQSVKLYSANKSSSYEFEMFPNQTEFNGMLGTNYLKCKDGSSATYKLMFRNLTGALTQTDVVEIQYTNGFYIPTPAGTAIPNLLQVYLAPEQLFHYPGPQQGLDEENNAGDVANPALTMNENRIPNFVYDTERKLISLYGNNQWFNTNNFTLYMNERLDSLISFSQYRNSVIDSGNYSNMFQTRLNTSFTSKNKGYSYVFPANLGQVLEDGTNLVSQTVSQRGTSTLKNIHNVILKYEESFSSGYCRDWLNGIQIATGSIAVDGEIIGASDSKRKVLTDFIIDPASTARDYVVYNNDGGTRYYKMGTTQDLRQVDLQVFFEDIWGNLRRLNILPSQECSIKLEFRPNNMVYNYVNTQQALAS